MQTCPTCGQLYPPETTAGLCPRCVLREALAPAPAANAEDDFERLGELGRGGMGVVVLARQRSLERLVALKVIAAGGRPVDWLEARLLREARAAARLQHPQIATVFEVGQGREGAYLAMEYCEGGSLRDLLRQGVLAPRAAAELGEKLAGAVDHAHAAGILHRDLKPSNILLAAGGEPKIADFGLAASTEGAGDLTATGEVAGSPAYLAPEVLRPGTAPTAAVDVYGLGAILYECVTGRPPFTGGTAAAVLAQVASAEAVAPRLVSREVPPDLDTIILKCLEKAPGARYASAAELREELRRFLEGRPIQARPLSPFRRGWRWARRHPGVAASLATIAALLVVVALVASVAAVRLERAHRRTEVERDRAEREGRRALAAEQQAREQLRAALLAQAKATRLTARPGQRFTAWEAARQAAQIRNGIDARNEAIAALMLPDWGPERMQEVWKEPGLSTATPLPGFQAFIHETERGTFSRRRFPTGETVWTWTAGNLPSAGQTVVSPDGRWVAVRLQNDEIHVLDAATGDGKFRLSGRPFAFKESRIWGYGVDMAFAPDGAIFAATRPEGGVTWHDVPSGRQRGEWVNPAWIVSLAFAHNGRWLAVGGSKVRDANVAAIIEMESGREVSRLTPPSRVDFVEWSADDRWLALGCRPVQVHAARDLSLRAVVPDRSSLHGRFLADNDRLLLTEQIGQTRLWEIDSGRLLLTKQDSGRPGMWYDGEPPRQWRYFSGGRVVLQSFQESPVVGSIRARAFNYTVPSIADPMDLSPDERWLLLGGWGGPTLIDLRSRRVVAEVLTGPLGSASVGRFDGPGTGLWVGQSQGVLQRHAFTTVPDGSPRMGPGETIAGHDGFLPTAVHRPTNVMALTHYREGRVRLLQLDRREILSEWALPRAGHVVFSPDGSLVLSNAEPSETGKAEIRETATGRVVRTLGAGAGRVADWSSGGWLIAGTGRERVQLWRTDTWSAGPALPSDEQFFSQLAALSPDGRLLALRGDQEIILRRTETAEELARLPIADSLRGVPALRFSADGRRLFVVRMEGRVDVWDLAALRAELASAGLDWRG